MQPFTTEPLPWEELTTEAEQLLRELFPICRSLTGDGVRQTLARLQQLADFELIEIPSGTAAFDWQVPPEWNIRQAFIEDGEGNRIVDFADNNLHVVSYSEPVDAELSWEELDPHLHSLPDLPKAIPYRTSYYNRSWGFCLADEVRQGLDRSARYRVLIDSSLTQGSMTIGEAKLAGDSGREYLISTYCCHPSLANDSLSGVVLWALLLRELQRRPHRHSYRFVVLPETVGAIAYLAANQKEMQQVEGGYIPTTVAGPGPFGYKQSFAGNHEVDRAARLSLTEHDIDYIAYPFDVNGSDEKQYSSPGFRIPIGTICKDKYYEYEAYHTSFDNLDFISSQNLIDCLKLYLSSIEKLETNLVYKSLAPNSEPMFGKRGLYPTVGGSIKQKAADLRRQHRQRPYAVELDDSIYGDELDAMRWVMFHADGSTGLMEVAERTGLPQRQLYDTAEKLCQHDLLKRMAP